MKITIPYVYVFKVTNSKEKNCKMIDVSLGKDKGFATIVWSVQNKTFDYFTKVKKGDAIYVPNGDMQVSVYQSERTGKAYANVIIFTSYIEPANWVKEKKEPKDEKKEQIEKILEETTSDTMDDALSDWDDEESNQETKVEEKPLTQEEFDKIVEEHDKQENNQLDEKDEWDNLD